MYIIELSIEYKVVAGIAVMVLLFASLLIAFISSQRKKLLYHQNLHALQEKQQEELKNQNILLEQKVQERTRELSHQKEELQKTILNLRSTQLQLVQREKMASLGELTAGIAHEIQNPLNFVNNFSDVTSDMLEEAKEGMKNGKYDEAIVTLEEANLNLKKISHHGKRASNIVNSMLEHSRSVEGEKECTDINALIQEYLMLAYHGYRAKDKNFKVNLVTGYDSTVGEMNVRPQEIGRVLVNLLNNAFYATQQKMKRMKSGYEPQIQIQTRKNENQIEISIKDNGIGIPEKVLSKIYQPFFTTKPAGEGTGLGLSLSFDVITKGHGGNLTVASTEGEGTEFILHLPAE